MVIMELIVTFIMMLKLFEKVNKKIKQRIKIISKLEVFTISL